MDFNSNHKDGNLNIREKENKKFLRNANLYKAIYINNQKKYGWMEPISTVQDNSCLLYTSPSPRDKRQSRMPSSA